MTREEYFEHVQDAIEALNAIIGDGTLFVFTYSDTVRALERELDMETMAIETTNWMNNNDKA